MGGRKINFVLLERFGEKITFGSSSTLAVAGRTPGVFVWTYGEESERTTLEKIYYNE
jgi:hypothetical protein